MSIVLEAKPIEIPVEIPGYGKFTLRRLGAGAEAEIMSRLREASEETEKVTAQYKEILDAEKEFVKNKNIEELEKLKATDEYRSAKQAIEHATSHMQRTGEYANTRMLKLWDSEDKDSLTRLLNDFTTEQLRALYQEAITISNSNGEDK